MNIEDVVYFSESVKIIDLDFENVPQPIDCFSERIHKYYLYPVQLLNKNRMAFAASTLLFATLDAVTYYSANEKGRLHSFLLRHLEESYYSRDEKEHLAKCFNGSFRNGLVHEARVKNECQFSYEYPSFLTLMRSYVIINPDYFYEVVEKHFNEYIGKLRAGLEIDDFCNKIKDQFLKDVTQLKRYSIRL